MQSRPPLDANTIYRLMVHSILPRPIAWINTVSANGVSDPQLPDAVGKMDGNGYAHTRERCELARPVFHPE